MKTRKEGRSRKEERKDEVKTKEQKDTVAVRTKEQKDTVAVRTKEQSAKGGKEKKNDSDEEFLVTRK